jgi:hypothetical protein
VVVPVRVVLEAKLDLIHVDRGRELIHRRLQREDARRDARRDRVAAPFAYSNCGSWASAPLASALHQKVCRTCQAGTPDVIRATQRRGADLKLAIFSVADMARTLPLTIDTASLKEFPTKGVWT